MANNISQFKQPLVAKSGFYYRKAWLDKGTSAELFYHERGMESAGESLGVTALESALSTSTQIAWGTGTSFMQYVMQGIGQAASSIVSGSRSFVNLWEQINSFFINNSKKVTAQEQSIIVGADTTHKKYQSSYSDIAIPPVTFYFINENDTDFYLERCSNLLDKVLPKQTTFNVKNEITNKTKGLENKLNEENNEETRNAINTMQESEEQIQHQFYKETPPGDLRDPFHGFSLNGITGFFSLRLGYKRLYYLVPSDVRIDISRSGSVFGGKTKVPAFSGKQKATNWRPHFIRVTVTLVRIGKIFTNDLKGNLLYCEDIKYGGAGSTKKKTSENVGATANKSKIDREATGNPPDNQKITANGETIESIDALTAFVGPVQPVYLNGTATATGNTITGSQVGAGPQRLTLSNNNSNVVDSINNLL